jgi:hypothetical protein
MNTLLETLQNAISISGIIWSVGEIHYLIKREKYAKERKVITKAILKDAVAKGLSDAEIAKLVREM